MGSFYSIHTLHDKNTNNKCLICWENFSNTNKIHVKCGKCNIMLHYNCALLYKQTNSVVFCPHCKRNHSLFIYDNHVYNCTEL